MMTVTAYMNGKEISKEELRNFAIVFDKDLKPIRFERVDKDRRKEANA